MGVKTDGSLVLYVKGNLSAGDELTITYGNKCNAELMNSYGFDLPDNQVSYPEGCSGTFTNQLLDV